MQEHLMMPKPLPHLEAKNFGVKPLSPIEVRDIKAEMIEFEEPHVVFLRYGSETEGVSKITLGGLGTGRINCSGQAA
jgi:hypothetical protein